MKLCYVGSLDSIHTERWIRYFSARQHEVHLLAPATTYRTPERVSVHFFWRIRTGIRILDVLLGALILIPTLLRFKAVFRRVAPDLVHVHYINDAALCTALTGVRPLVVTAWGSDVLIEPRKSALRRWVVQMVLRQADLITCDANHMKEALIRLGADPSRVAIVYFGTDTERFSPERRDQGLRTRLGLDGTTVVVSSRNLEPLYDVESLIMAIPLVLAETPAVKFVIAGSGSDERRLRALAESSGLGEAVRFLGRLTEHEMARHLASADIYVSTALSDAGLASSTAEAMASGLPVIITDVGDNRRWVTDARNGFIVPPHDPRALAARIVRLVQDGETRKRFAGTNRRIIEERNSWNREMAKMDELYRALTAGR
jgi:glycosyltransferase involved in cell wall biosynthesis